MSSTRPQPAAMHLEFQRRTTGVRGLWLACAMLACAPAAMAAEPGDPGPRTVGAVAKAARPLRCHASTRTAYAAPVFLGYACRDRECTAHKSGFAWAERNGVMDVGECLASPNPAFVEGCRAYVEEAVTPEQAGFAWARENELDDSCRCQGGGTGFEAGCAAYVMEAGR